MGGSTPDEVDELEGGLARAGFRGVVVGHHGRAGIDDGRGRSRCPTIAELGRVPLMRAGDTVFAAPRCSTARDRRRGDVASRDRRSPSGGLCRPQLDARVSRSPRETSHARARRVVHPDWGSRSGREAWGAGRRRRAVARGRCSPASSDSRQYPYTARGAARRGAARGRCERASRAEPEPRCRSRGAGPWPRGRARARRCSPPKRRAGQPRGRGPAHRRRARRRRVAISIQGRTTWGLVAIARR
jgi:hypothetical protein